MEVSYLRPETLVGFKYLVSCATMQWVFVTNVVKFRNISRS
jgi:hypothetical protein